jgi:hypothetical protein
MKRNIWNDTNETISFPDDVRKRVWIYLNIDTKTLNLVSLHYVISFVSFHLCSIQILWVWIYPNINTKIMNLVSLHYVVSFVSFYSIVSNLTGLNLPEYWHENPEFGFVPFCCFVRIVLFDCFIRIVPSFFVPLEPMPFTWVVDEISNQFIRRTRSILLNIYNVFSHSNSNKLAEKSSKFFSISFRISLNLNAKFCFRFEFRYFDIVSSLVQTLDTLTPNYCLMMMWFPWLR